MTYADKPAQFLHETDVLVLGSGVAGCLAAIGAREEGARVVVVEKGHIDSSGAAGGGNDHFQAHLNSGPDWDSDEAATEYFSRGAGWGASTNMVEKTFTKVVGGMVARLEKLGVEFYRKEDGSYFRTEALGQPGPWWLMMKNGVKLKRILAKGVRASGAEVVNQVMITNLFTKDGRVFGAFGLDRRTGDFHVFRSSSVVMCMGSRQSRVWSNNSTHDPFNIWLYPYNNGTQITIAADVGAKVVGLEQCICSTLPKGFGAPGMNAITGMGGLLRNIHGESFMEKYYPMGDRSARVHHIIAGHEEVRKGNGPPFFADMTGCSPGDLDLLLRYYLPVDKNTYGEYLDQRGVDIRKQPLEVELGEYSGTGNLLVNQDCESVTLPGLFGTPFTGMLSSSMTSGFVAGREAAKSALRRSKEKVPAPEAGEIDREKQKVFKALAVKDGYTPREFEDLIRQVMNYYMGYNRNQKGLEIALEKLRLIERYSGQIKAANMHELTRANEALHLLPYAQMMVISVMQRGGFAGYYKRSDVEINKTLSGKHVSLWREVGAIKSSYDPIEA